MKFYGESDTRGLAGVFVHEKSQFTINELLQSLNLDERKQLIRRIETHNEQFGEYKGE